MGGSRGASPGADREAAFGRIARVLSLARPAIRSGWTAGPLLNMTSLRSAMPIEAEPESCSVCADDLCPDCWETWGRCGRHPGEEERRLRAERRPISNLLPD